MGLSRATTGQDDFSATRLGLPQGTGNILWNEAEERRASAHPTPHPSRGTSDAEANAI
jgi:hypothetical protein